MKAVVLEETRRIAVREVRDAEMEETTDVLMRVTSTAICGMDLLLSGDPVEQIKAEQGKAEQGKWRSGGAFRNEKPLAGVSCAVDAIGFQARSREDWNKEEPHWVTEAIAELIDPAGRVNVVGLWPPKDLNGTEGTLQEGRLLVPWDKFFGKNVSIVMGRDDDQRWNAKLHDTILTGASKPSLW